MNKIIRFKTPMLTAVLVIWSAMTFLPQIAAARSADKVLCRVETDHSTLMAGTSQEVILKITLDAPSVKADVRRPPVNLSLVLDRSGSMNGAKIEQAKAAAIEALKRLGLSDLFSVVVYDTNIQTIVPAQRPDNVRYIEGRIRQIGPGGSTALFGGVSQGAAEIRKNIEQEGLIHRIILLSDGLANVGPRTPEDLGRLGAALLKENISVTTVGVGTDYNEDLMARLAQKSDGNTYFVESSYDLTRIFAAELGDVLNIVANQVRLTITFSDGVQPLEIIGREGRIKGRQAHLYMNQLYGNQEKYVLVKVRIPASDSGDHKKVATAEIDYQDPVSRKQIRSRGASYASFSSDSAAVRKSANAKVIKAYQLNLNALAQEKAIGLSDRGRTNEAVIELKKSAAKLKAYGRQLQDKELMEEAQALEVQADQIKSQGMTKKSRKKLRTESYQQKVQQQSR